MNANQNQVDLSTCTTSPTTPPPTPFNSFSIVSVRQGGRGDREYGPAQGTGVWGGLPNTAGDFSPTPPSNKAIWEDTYFNDKRVIAFDTETTLIGFNEDGFCTEPVPDLVCLSWTDGYQTGLVKQQDALRLVSSWLGDPRTVLVGHNVAFDLHVMNKYSDCKLIKPILSALKSGRIWDTCLAGKLNSIKKTGRITAADGFRFSLAAMSAALLGRELKKDETRTTYGDVIDVPISEWEQTRVEYAINDAVATYDIFQCLRKAGLVSDTWRQAKASFCLNEISRNGIYVDKTLVPSAKEHLSITMNDAAEYLKARGYFNAKGALLQDKQRELVAAHCAHPELTETGKVKIDEENLVKTDHPDAIKLLKFKHARKTLNEVLKIDRFEQPRLHPQFNPIVSTGRTSCRKPNVQQVPREGVRHIFRPESGNKYIIVDYSTLELRTLAQVMFAFGLNSKLHEAIIAGYDVHTMFAANMLGLDYDEGKILKSTKDKDFERARNCSKAANFGLPVGMSADTLIAYARSYGSDNQPLDLTKKEANKLVRWWHKQWPEMRGYQNVYSSIDGIVYKPSGREKKATSYCETLNAPFQGLAADGAKEALFRLIEACNDERNVLFGSMVVNFIHDEFILETTDTNVEAKLQEMKRIMVEAFDDFTPDVPIEVEGQIVDEWRK